MLARWPLTDMIEGAVGCRVLVEGRRGEDRAAMMETLAFKYKLEYKGTYYQTR